MRKSSEKRSSRERETAVKSETPKLASGKKSKSGTFLCVRPCGVRRRRLRCRRNDGRTGL